MAFVRKKDFLVCVDSDGCAMDTMDIKHIRCFGPCMVEEWGLHQWAEPILARWNEVNLYTMTRGINRFKGLAHALTEVNAQITPIEGIDELNRFVAESDELSNEALARAIAAAPDCVSLTKALRWSEAVNAAIRQLPEEKLQPFPLAKEALCYAHTLADVAIVSSANRGAVMEEWERFGLLPHTDVVMAQDAGSKATCIATLLREGGYAPDHVLMCGDAPGDLAAAEQNGVYYYPIRVRAERESWQGFLDEGLQRLLDGRFGGDYQNEQIAAFKANLGG